MKRGSLSPALGNCHATLPCGYVRVWISANDSSVKNYPLVTERNFDFVGTAHHVVAAENVTVFRYYDTGTKALFAALSRHSIVTIGVTKELPENGSSNSCEIRGFSRTVFAV